MPLFLVPPPQRIRISRRNFAVTPGLTARIDPVVAPEVEPLVAVLRDLIPGIQVTRKLDVPAAITLDPLEPDPESPAILRLEVHEAGISLAARGAGGWLRGAVLLEQLAEEKSVIGVSIHDWPAFAVRQLHLPRSPAEVAIGFWEGLLKNLSRCGFNRLSMAASDTDERISPSVEASAARWGIEITVGALANPFAGTPPGHVPRLVEDPDQGYPRDSILEEIHRSALAALEIGASGWGVDAGSLGEETFLGGFWPALYFAGSCAWNPKKTEARAIRRTFGVRFLGTTSADAPAVLEEMEAAAAAGDGMLAGLDTPFPALFSEDAFRPELRRRALGLVERARDAQGHARRVRELLGEEGTRERPSFTPSLLRSLTLSLEWPIRRLETEAQYLLDLEQVREIYADAFISSGHARAAAQRLRAAAETLEGVANRIEELSRLLVRLWPLERAGEPAPSLRALYTERVGRLREKAAELRRERDRYIQSGAMASPDAIGLEREGWAGRTGRGPGRVVLPGRLPRQHSPAWWPEGGLARVRVDVRSTHGGLPWEVIVNLRALSGEESAFNVGAARLVRFDPETGAVGALMPLQLTRGGVVLVPEAGSSVYYLYLDPRGGEPPETDRRSPVPPFRTRARSPKEGVVLENGLLALRIERTRGIVDRCQVLLGPDREPEELLSTTPGASDGLFELPEAGGDRQARVRVVENGPLLARALVEFGDSRTLQYDLYAGARWCEFATNAAVPSIRNVLPREIWRGARVALPATDGAERAQAMGEPCVATEDWAGWERSDGLTVAALCPDGPAGHILADSTHTIEGRPDVSHLLLWCGEARGHEPIEALLAALRQQPVVQFGVLEERRAREF